MFAVELDGLIGSAHAAVEELEIRLVDVAVDIEVEVTAALTRRSSRTGIARLEAAEIHLVDIALLSFTHDSSSTSSCLHAASN